MTDPDLVECPADGCEYENLPRSVASHYSGKKDDVHSGGYERARTLLEDADTDSVETSEADLDEADLDDASESTTKSDGAADLEFPENPDPDPVDPASDDLEDDPVDDDLDMDPVDDVVDDRDGDDAGGSGGIFIVGAVVAIAAAGLTMVTRSSGSNEDSDTDGPADLDFEVV